LWYFVNGSDAAKQHWIEVQEFGNLLGNEVLFRSDTYQNVFNRLSVLSSVVTPETSYQKYLQSRYYD
jgi:hypothetical protein